MRVCTVVGARPQFVKAASLGPALEAEGFEEILVHTGQHYDYDMSQIFFNDLGITAPKVNLEVGSGPHARQTGTIMERLENFLMEEPPFDIMLLYGDTNSTLAGALVASKMNVPIAHVEAGLRSFNRAMPEEVNRIVTDHLSRWLFAPSKAAVSNLANEGLSKATFFVGDVMLDATRIFGKSAHHRYPLETLTSHPSDSFALATVHRPSNTDIPANLQKILEAFGRLPWPVMMPLHPRTKQRISGLKVPTNVEIRPPEGYLSMLTLIQNARRMLTDSGGLQKEAYWLGCPCVTLREETEWLETLENQWNFCAGNNTDAIVEAALSSPSGPQMPFGKSPEGSPSETIARILKNSLHLN